jgi:serine protease AprX
VTTSKRSPARPWLATALTGLVALGATLPAAALAAEPPDAASRAVIVRGPSTAAAAAAVAAVDGEVERALPVVDGVAASIRPSALGRLTDAGLQVSDDVEVRPTSWPDGAIAELDADDAARLAVQTTALGTGPGARRGGGVAVAVIDTGVDATHPSLRGQVHAGPDFSDPAGQGVDDSRADEYGHGTAMAGLVAGQGVGVAPDARIVAVKVAGRDGSTSLSRVLAAIDWTISHQDELNIGVLNLSFGVDAPPAATDPLVAAAEVAWASGLTVVASAGNEGSSVTSPGWAPWVITVGALDTAGTASHADDTVPSWSGRGTYRGQRKPDVVAPGVDVVSLRTPGSTIDPRSGSTAHLRGSGTSLATALVSGSAAAYLAQHPDATPWAVKRALTTTTRPVPGSRPGAVSLDAALTAGPDAAPARPGNARGNGNDQLANGRPGGFVDQPGGPWSGSRWSGSRWSDTQWAGSRWSVGELAGSRWSGSRWSGSRWSGSRWSNTDWSGSRWSGSRWSGSRWSGTDWAGSRWSATAWSATDWQPAGR